MIAPDVTTLALLEAQLRNLSAVLDRLAAARRDLVPATATFWHGEARRAYNYAVGELDTSIASTLEVLELARQNTVAALAEEVRRA